MGWFWVGMFEIERLLETFTAVASKARKLIVRSEFDVRQRPSDSVMELFIAIAANRSLSPLGKRSPRLPPK